MKSVDEAGTLQAQLARLPVTEHAILLNRFKFLSLVQRVAAADVAEMIHTVGLDALSYKGALQNMPPPPCMGAVEEPTADRPYTRSAMRRGSLQERGGYRQAVAVSAATNGLSPETTQRQRFTSREKEQEFIDRMTQPQRRRDPLDAQIRKHPRGRYGEGTSPLREVPSLPIRRTANGTVGKWNEQAEADGGDAAFVDVSHESDAVVVDSSGDWQHYEVGRGKPHSGGRHRPQMAPPRPVERSAKEEAVAVHNTERRIAAPAASPETVTKMGRVHVPTAVSKSDETANHYENTPPLSLHPDTLKNPSLEVSTPRTLQGSTTRSRGPFAPKAKPKAAAEVPRVPMEVIRHASALLAKKNTAALPLSPRPLQEPLPATPAAQESTSWDSQVAPYGYSASQFQSVIPPALRGGKKEEHEVQQGHTQPVAALSSLPDDALAELASCVERMLQDHRSILDGIVKEEATPSPDVPKIARPIEKPGRGSNADNSVDSSGGKTLRAGRAPLRGADNMSSAHVLQAAHDMLEDFSDEEDELLLVSRLQRQVGVMGRELEVIEEREKHYHHTFGEEGEEDEDEESEGAHRVVVSPKHPGRRVVFADPRKAPQKSRRRRGEMPRAIFERLRSFQKENREYVRYTEREWNTSNVTEQVFAHRLTDSLVEDTFNEVIEEVADILDTYVEGLASHELH
ncbi:hypothetical protein DQ04_04071080 [Trypanosoma grayi]|uniref:hypothetical protein n=1 Tax=Trypanosoma grayi TaxID=71804 RepID=UPI0004F43327|nr:hypothetical protein DQ04_04071080 [Trypanosoma grayi]KEG10188.1 hypothetical protein DQ04_04071080 [Trypanosoma grayi]